MAKFIVFNDTEKRMHTMNIETISDIKIEQNNDVLGAGPHIVIERIGSDEKIYIEVSEYSRIMHGLQDKIVNDISDMSDIKASFNSFEFK